MENHLTRPAQGNQREDRHLQEKEEKVFGKGGRNFRKRKKKDAVCTQM